MDSSPAVHQRPEFTREPLHRAGLAGEPLEQFRQWLEEAVAAQVPDPYAFTLATVRQDGSPAARTVLLKAVDVTGLVFTSSESPKTTDLRAQPGVAAVFHWPTILLAHAGASGSGGRAGISDDTGRKRDALRCSAS